MPRNKKPQADKENNEKKDGAVPDAGQSSLTLAADASFVVVGGEPDDWERFPIVGIGASAGGLEAAEGFFKAMPSDSGFAFVLVQHLDPTHESILAELLQRWTSMVVAVVEDGMRVEPNSIYVIPPNRDMALSEGRLRLIEPSAARGLRLPIDYLFRSMAADLHERAICIILSGTGTDGSLGLKEIRGVGGMAMAQDPETAKYHGMPRNAIATGLVDYILPPGEMPARLIEYADGYYIPGGRRGSQPQTKDADVLAKIFLLLQHQKKHDFALYKRNTIDRRIKRRMAVNHYERLLDYLNYLQTTPREIEILFRELLIGVTSFFRDPEAFEMLEKRGIPQILDSLRPSEAVRVWVPGCSTGEEAYSIAMLIREQMSVRKQEHQVQIFATDIDEQAIKRARVGLYPNNIAADVSPERLQRFFVKNDGTYQISKQIREMVVFAVQSITKDPPFSRMNLISCRNLLIYLGPELQKKVIPMFHYSLNAGGFLFLGTSESLGDFDRFFHATDRKAKLFQHDRASASIEERREFAAPALTTDSISAKEPRAEKPATVREVAEKLILQDFAPPCVIINTRNEILYFQGKTSDFLEPSSGDASLNLFRMVREELRLPLSAVVRKAIEQRQEAAEEGVRLYDGDTPRSIDLIVKPVSGPLNAPPGLFMVVFQERSSRKEEGRDENGSGQRDERDQRLMETDRELQATREYLQATVEQLETTNEELRSTNEEMESSNEELHSTNEELETAKEELQSVNEELIIVNSELQSKLDELTHTNDDLNNLLAAVEVGIVFLDTQLNIQRFNPASTKLINLIQGDIGRPMAHIVNNVTNDHLVEDAQEVLETLIPKEVEVETREKGYYRVRIRPYRTIENIIDGLVMTFSDITEQKRSEIQIRRARQYVEGIVDTVRDPLLVLDQNLNIVLASRAFNQQYHTRQDELSGQPFFEVGNGAWNNAGLRQHLEQVVSSNESLEDFVLEQDFPGQGRRSVRLTARHIHPEAGQNPETGQEPLIVLVIEPMTDHADGR